MSAPGHQQDGSGMAKAALPLRSRRRIKLALLLIAAVSLYTVFYLGHFPTSKDYGQFFSSGISKEGISGKQRNATLQARAEEVKMAFRRGYGQYLRHSYPRDELRPLSNESIDNFNGWGVTVVDSIDTMFLMGLTEEYEHARSHVATTDFQTCKSGVVPFFETIIRYLGGLLSAYHLTEDQTFLSAADHIGRELLPAFNTTWKLPSFSVDLVTRTPQWGWSGRTILLSEAASNQMEYKYLAHLTGHAEYFQKSDQVTRFLQKKLGGYGLWNTMWDAMSGLPSNAAWSIGALGDSAYEYLLKAYIMSGRTEKYLLEIYIKSMRGAVNRLVYLSRTRQLLYITEVVEKRPQGTMQHLSCFFPGLLALGDYLLQDSDFLPGEREKFRFAAEGLAYTCWILYADQITGLGPEEVRFHPYNGDDDYQSGRWVHHLDRWKAKGRKGLPPGLRKPPPLRGKTGKHKDYDYANAGYLLRPEAIETMYIMWRTTGDVVWRERAWKMFEAINTNTTVDGGAFASRSHVDIEEKLMRDESPSYFFAETLKYAYLACLEDDPLPLDQYVFNTEAHPLPIFSWTQEQRERFGV